MTAGHAAPDLLSRYVDGDPALPADAVWAMEAHLERCPDCRAALAGVVATTAPDLAGLVDRVRSAVDARLAPPPRRPVLPRLRRAVWRWSAPAALPWLFGTVLVPLAAVLLDLATTAADGPATSVVLLVAPVLPLFAVAASWTRRVDPAGELVASTARAGIALVLRRALVALLVTLPPLAVAGHLAGTAPAQWLLPCVAFTAASLALGALVGVGRAASALIVAWAAFVVGPSLVLARPPTVLDPAGSPGWAALAAAALVVLVAWRDAFRRLASQR